MKRLFVGLMVVALTAVLASPGAAQEGTKGGSVQVFGGANIAKQTAAGAVNTEYKTGFLAGAAFTYRLNQHVGLGIAGDYSQAGTGTSGTLIQTDIDYLYIGANLSVYLPIPESPLLPWAYVGLAYGITLTCDGDLQSTFPSTVDCKDAVSNDFAVQFGAGLSFGIGAAGALFVGGQYRASLTSIDEADPDRDIKNQQLGIYGGYSFRFY